MAAFKWRHFAGEVILWAVRWYCRYGISYRELEEMLRERGVAVDHTTLYRWTLRYAPEIDKEGATLDFYLADRRNAKAAKRFLGAALKRSRDWIPRVINTDKNPAYGEAIAELKKQGVIPK